MADVFLSYAREDQARASQIAHGLQGIGLDVFWDNEIPPGQTWADYIEGKLAACKVVIVVWSEHSTKSQWVREEARMGRDRAKLIPVMIDGSPAPFGFGEVQAADLSSWNGEATHGGWQRFSQAVYGAVNGAGAAAPQATAPPVYAPPPAPQPQYAAPPSGDIEQLSPIGYIQKCFRLFIDGKGRARRAEYWWWVGFFLLVLFAAVLIDGAASGFNAYTSLPNTQYLSSGVYIALLAPGVSVLSRRLHDIGQSGWIAASIAVGYILGGAFSASGIPAGALLSLLAVVAAIVVGVIPSRPGPNQYGPNPKGE